MMVRMALDFTECDQARLARDATYDGRFYTGVHTTGIYCRPVCPVRPARSANVSFRAALLSGWQWQRYAHGKPAYLQIMPRSPRRVLGPAPSGDRGSCQQRPPDHQQ